MFDKHFTVPENPIRASVYVLKYILHYVKCKTYVYSYICAYICESLSSLMNLIIIETNLSHAIYECVY